LLRQNFKFSFADGRFDAPWPLGVDSDKLTTIVALVFSRDNASNKTRLRKITGLTQIGHCHLRNFHHDPVLMSYGIHHAALHPTWKRGIHVTGNLHSQVQQGYSTTTRGADLQYCTRGISTEVSGATGKLDK
jgi:hypothetical protein